MVRKGRRCTVLYFLLILSGFAGMGYEMVWTRMLGVGLGHEIAAVLAVVCAFFFGLALGGWSLDGVISRSLRPGRWYAVLELVIGAWALSLLWGIPWANDVALRLMGTAPGPVRQWAVSFVVPMITFLPATFAMGGTLPAMERLVSRMRKDGWSVAGVYAAQTLGAVLGTLVTTFLIIPEFGFPVTVMTLAAANGICAVGVLVYAARGEESRPPVPVESRETMPVARLLITLFFTGLVGIGYEVLVVRVRFDVESTAAQIRNGGKGQ